MAAENSGFAMIVVVRKPTHQGPSWEVDGWSVQSREDPSTLGLLFSSISRVLSSSAV